jgi:hypothetical protein
MAFYSQSMFVQTFLSNYCRNIIIWAYSEFKMASNIGSDIDSDIYKFLVLPVSAHNNPIRIFSISLVLTWYCVIRITTYAAFSFVDAMKSLQLNNKHELKYIEGKNS